MKWLVDNNWWLGVSRAIKFLRSKILNKSSATFSSSTGHQYTGLKPDCVDGKILLVEKCRRSWIFINSSNTFRIKIILHFRMFDPVRWYNKRTLLQYNIVYIYIKYFLPKIAHENSKSNTIRQNFNFTRLHGASAKSGQNKQFTKTLVYSIKTWTNKNEILYVRLGYSLSSIIHYNFHFLRLLPRSFLWSASMFTSTALCSNSQMLTQ